MSFNPFIFINRVLIYPVQRHSHGKTPTTHSTAPEFPNNLNVPEKDTEGAGENKWPATTSNAKAIRPWPEFKYRAFESTARNLDEQLVKDGYLQVSMPELDLVGVRRLLYFRPCFSVRHDRSLEFAKCKDFRSVSSFHMSHMSGN